MAAPRSPSRQDSLSDLAAQFQAEHHAVEQAIGDALTHAMAGGDVLIAMKDKVGHGNFQKCCKTYFSGTAERTLRQYRQLAEARPAIEAKRHGHATFSIQDALLLIRSGLSRKSERRKSALPSGHAFNRESLAERQRFAADLDLSKLLEALPLPKRAEMQRRATHKGKPTTDALSDTLGKAVRAALSLSTAAMQTDFGKAQLLVAINKISDLLKNAGHDLNEVEIVLNPARLDPKFEREQRARRAA